MSVGIRPLQRQLNAVTVASIPIQLISRNRTESVMSHLGGVRASGKRSAIVGLLPPKSTEVIEGVVVWEHRISGW